MNWIGTLAYASEAPVLITIRMSSSFGKPAQRSAGVIV
jgi:hypothetical protein